MEASLGGAYDGIMGWGNRRSHRVAFTVVGAVLGAGLSGVAADHLADVLDVTLPSADAVAVADAFFDLTPTQLHVSAGWQRLTITVPAWRVRADWTLWRRMRFEDWDTVPGPLREQGLSAMLRRDGSVLAGPEAWARLDAAAWDTVPLPVRAMAVLRMIDERVAAAADGRFGATEQGISDTVAAIVMVESWFEHRAVNINTNGERDLGLAQASAGCRRRLGLLHARGEIPNRFEEADYFDPLKASQVAVLWYLRLLHAAGGDESTAIRAYHKGLRAARAGKGVEYLDQVVAKRTRFIRNREAPPSWRFLFTRTRVTPRETTSSTGGANPGGTGPARH